MRTLTRVFFLLIAGGWIAAALAAGPDDLRRAAESGDVEAQLELGVLYEYGYGLPKNEVPALAWYTLAAERGHSKAAARRDSLRGRLQPAEVEQAAALVTQWRVAKPQPAVADAPSVPAGEQAATDAPAPATADAGADVQAPPTAGADSPMLDAGAAADILVPRPAP
jgi:TPR repeat protein